jgi:phage terminase small subunit
MTKRKRPPPKPRAPRPPRVPPAPGTLTAKQAAFVAEYLKDGNAAGAARRTGYHVKHAPALLRIPWVVAAVQEGQRAALHAAGVKKADLLRELGYCALSRVSRYFDPVTHNARHPSDLAADADAALAGFEVIIKNAEAGDDQTDTIHKFKLWDKVKAIELYMRHYGMLIDEVHVTDDRAEARVARLEGARRRVGP